jgi:DNA primase
MALGASEGAGGFTREWIAQLRSRLDIVDVVSQTVPLKKNGGRYWGLCPFHGEKTPSFSVRPDVQVYYCFGCKAGGDVISFVMETERLEFVEALKELAARANMPLPDATDLSALRRERSERERVLALNRRAARWFHDRLWTEQGKPYLEYLYRRGLNDAGIRRFGLGASGADGQSLLRALTDDGTPEELIVRACLAGSRDGRTFDFFRGRVMFPILDARGNVIAFGGRAMGDAQPKYLNSPDTPVFNKRRNVYGANELRKARNLKRLVLVEGYMDAVSMLNAGVAGVVATLGTSLTPEQVALMKRYAPEALIAYDGDEAGQKAALRALDLFQAAEMPARVITFPDGMDPDDFIRREGLAGFEALAGSDGARSAYQYRLSRLAAGYDLAKPEDRMSYAIEAAKILKTVREPVEMDSLLDRLAVDTGYSKEILARQVRAAPAPKPPRDRIAQAANAVLPDVAGWSGSARADAETGLQAAGVGAVEANKAARTLLSMMAARRVPAGAADCEDFISPVHQAVCRGLAQGLTAADLLDGAVEDDARAEMIIIFGETGLVAEDAAPRVINDCIERLRLAKLGARIADTTEALKTASGASRIEGAKALAELLALQQKLKSGAAGRQLPQPRPTRPEGVKTLEYPD